MSAEKISDEEISAALLFAVLIESEKQKRIEKRQRDREDAERTANILAERYDKAKKKSLEDSK